MDGGIIENEDMFIVRIVLLENIHCVIDLPQNVLIGEVPLPIYPRSEEYSSGFHSVRGTQPAIVSRDEVRDHQRDAFALWQRDRFLTDMNPSILPPIILIECTLIVEPEDSVTDRRRGRRVNNMGDVIPVPGSDSRFVLSKSGEINILTIVYNVGTFVAVKISAFQWLSPFEVKPRHPLACSFEGNRFTDTVTFDHLRFLDEINDSLGRNVCPDVSDVNEQLLDEIDIVNEGTAAGVCVAVVWKRRPVTNEILCPLPKPSTTASTLPDNGSSVIGSLDPSFTRGVNCKEPIQVIESGSEDNIRANYGVP